MIAARRAVVWLLCAAMLAGTLMFVTTFTGVDLAPVVDTVTAAVESLTSGLGE